MRSQERGELCSPKSSSPEQRAVRWASHPDCRGRWRCCTELLYAHTASLRSGADAAIADGTRTSPSFRQVPGSSLLWDDVREFGGIEGGWGSQGQAGLAWLPVAELGSAGIGLQSCDDHEPVGSA